ncbi:MAG: flagellar M-ring protein FliF [Treponema sp.]|nr:flagellar M-ring protein FliF [Treponema sp.]
MNEWLKNNSAKLRERWGKWSIVQKIILAGIVVAIVVAIILTVRVNSTPGTAALFNSPVTDQKALDDIRFRLDAENVWYNVSTTGYVSVKDEATARRMRALLISENIVPVSVDVFKEQIDINNWNTTDRERDTAELRRVTQQVKEHIEALNDVARADVVITPKKPGLYTSDTEPAQASVILSFKPGSDMASDRKKIRGVQNLILRAVSGLVESNIEIDDVDGNRLNDFEGLAELDRIALAGKESELRQKEEATLRAKVLSLLNMYGDTK